MKYEVKLMKVIGKKVDELPRTSLEKEHYESHVEDWIELNPLILGEELLIIDRQPRTTEGKKPDLLALDEEGNLVIIEVKNEAARRDVIGQVLDYASQLTNSTEENLEKIAKSKNIVLRQAFRKMFGDDKGVNFNNKQRMIIVAPELDASVPRIIDFLATHGLDIQTVTFGFHKNGSAQYITRGIIKPERIAVEVSESIIAYFQSPPHLANTLKKIKQFFEEENCYFRKPRGDEISFFSNAHGHRVGTLNKQKRAMVVNLHPNYSELEDIQRVRAIKNCGIFPFKDRKTANGGEIIDWIAFRRIRKWEDFEQYIDEIRRAMASLDGYYANPPSDWKRVSTKSS